MTNFANGPMPDTYDCTYEDLESLLVSLYATYQSFKQDGDSCFQGELEQFTIILNNMASRHGLPSVQESFKEPREGVQVTPFRRQLSAINATMRFQKDFRMLQRSQGEKIDELDKRDVSDIYYLVRDKLQVW